MSEFRSNLPERPSLPQLRKQARELLKRFRANEPAAIERFRAAGIIASPKLADAQFAIAREHGFASWPKLRKHVEANKPDGLELYEALAADLGLAQIPRAVLFSKRCFKQRGARYRAPVAPARLEAAE